ncbi:phosphoribosyltransferase-like protein, partial [Ferruginibacter sp.]
LDDELQKRYQIELKNCGTKSKKYALYVDDILVSGNTIYNDLAGHKDYRTEEYIPGWLEFKNEDGLTNAQKVIAKEKIVIINVFCLHTWNDIEWRLKKKFGDEIRNKIRYYYYYKVQNLRIFNNQKLNFAYPAPTDNENIKKYFNSINETSFGEVAFRKKGTPAVESFFSSPENRIRFENILLEEGVKLFDKVDKLKRVQRPLGITVPFHKTLGTGTLFFTWRNISNTTPIVFWWDNHGWYFLFELKNRGGN